MEPSAAQLWEWLGSCRACGKMHLFRLWEEDNPGAGGTWRARDGHYYEPRIKPQEVVDLKLEWEAATTIRG